jgi:hypothetical protein
MVLISSKVISVTESNWQELKPKLVLELKNIITTWEIKRLIQADSFNKFFDVLYSNYVPLKFEYASIIEIENMKQSKYKESEFIIWLLETYCLKIENYSLSKLSSNNELTEQVIKLHKDLIAGKFDEFKWKSLRNSTGFCKKPINIVEYICYCSLNTDDFYFISINHVIRLFFHYLDEDRSIGDSIADTIAQEITNKLITFL